MVHVVFYPVFCICVNLARPIPLQVAGMPYFGRLCPCEACTRVRSITLVWKIASRNDPTNHSRGPGSLDKRPRVTLD